MRATNEHDGFIERSVQTIKEHVRSMCHSVPYKRFTKLMVNSLIDRVVYWLNAFTPANGISCTLSPENIVLGRTTPDFNHGRIAFGSYALVYVGTKNNMKARSVPAIALRRSNELGGHYFMSLHTGKQLHSYHWRELPITDEVIESVHSLATSENQPTLVDGEVTFECDIGVPIQDNNEF